MTLLEIEHRRSQRARRKNQKEQKRKQKKRRSALDAPLSMSNDNQVLTFREWCQLNRFSERTGRRILRSGAGPIVTQLSEKRIGITIGNNARWQAARARA